MLWKKMEITLIVTVKYKNYLKENVKISLFFKVNFNIVGSGFFYKNGHPRLN